MYSFEPTVRVSLAGEQTITHTDPECEYVSWTNRPDADSDRSRVHRLECSVEWPPGHVAAYLLTGAEPILVDAGMAGEQGRDELFEGLRSHGVDPDAIDHLLLTHPHTDHAGQVQTLRELGTPTVHAPGQTRDRFERDLETVEAATRRNLREAGVDERYIESSLERLLDAHRSHRDCLPLEAVDNWIEDEAPVTIGDRTFEPIYTPGHHAPHYCYATTLGEERVVFAGDMAIEPFRAIALHVNFDDGVRDGISAYLEALERLEGHSFDRVYPGHGPVHDRFDAVVDRSISDLETQLEDCLEVLEQAGDALTATGVALERTDSVRERARKMPEIVGSLATLEREGRVRSRLEEGVRYYEREYEHDEYEDEHV
ncbi:Glyoxylase, beta-lactamase superfamily II [Natronorubrum daqingense]|uniref:Glyoxylase, beta-lactamase superfamily II n=1 Tax=Natronorubrum daqingense TaxID=588898 RepID=A0A1N7E886_9EURY|nr:Glyoxylase, beta-lactamase superfamily II [Natronorubrum daqingense]